MKTILLLNVYKFSGADIGDLREKNPTNRFMEDLLPEYCLRLDNGKIDRSYGYLQWVGYGDESQQEYWLFNIEGGDYILMEEIRQLSLEDWLEDYDLRILFEQIPPNLVYPYDGFRLSIGASVKIIIELDYQQYPNYEFGGYDYETNMYICGLYDNNLNIIDPYGYESKV